MGGYLGDVRIVETGHEQAVRREQFDKPAEGPLDRVEIGEDVGVIEFDRSEDGDLRLIM